MSVSIKVYSMHFLCNSKWRAKRQLFAMLLQAADKNISYTGLAFVLTSTTKRFIVSDQKSSSIDVGEKDKIR